jgi:hypothetical protein
MKVNPCKSGCGSRTRSIDGSDNLRDHADDRAITE